MDIWTIYWVLKLDTLGGLCVVICILSFIGTIASTIFFLYWKPKRPIYKREGTEENPSEHFLEIKKDALSISRKCIIACIILFFISFPLATFLPSTQQACVIYVLPKIANNEYVQKMPNNISKLVSEKLAEWIDDVKGIKAEIKTETK